MPHRLRRTACVPRFAAVLLALVVGLAGCAAPPAPPATPAAAAAPQTPATVRAIGEYVREAERLLASGGAAAVARHVAAHPGLAGPACRELALERVDQVADPGPYGWVKEPQRLIEALVAAEPGALSPTTVRALAAMKKGERPFQAAADPLGRLLDAHGQVPGDLDLSKAANRARRLAALELSLKAAEAAGSHLGRAYGLQSRGRTLIEGDPRSAPGRADVAAAMAIFEELGAPQLRETPRTILAVAFMRSGQHKQALAAAVPCAATLRALKLTHANPYKVCSRIALYAAGESGDFDAALEHGAAAVAALEADKDPELIDGLELMTIAAIKLLERDSYSMPPATLRRVGRAAWTYGLRAAEIRLQQKQPLAAARIHLRLAEVAIERLAAFKPAAERARQAVTLYEQLPAAVRAKHEAELSYARVLLGRALPGKEGHAMLRHAAAEAERAKLPARAADALIFLGDAVGRKGGNLDLYWKAAQLAQGAKNPRMLLMALGRLGGAAVDDAAAESWRERAARLAAEVGAGAEEDHRYYYAQFLVTRKRPKAAAYLDQCLAWAQQKRPSAVLRFVGLGADARAAAGTPSALRDALAWLERWRTTYAAAGDLRSQAHLLTDGAVLRRKLLDLAGAERDVRQALALLGRAGAGATERTNLLLNQLLTTLGAQQSRRLLEQAKVEVTPELLAKLGPLLDRSRAPLADEIALIDGLLAALDPKRDAEARGRLLVARAQYLEHEGRSSEALAACQTALAASAALPAGVGLFADPERDAVIRPMTAARALECKGRLERRLARASLEPAVRKALFKRAIAHYALAHQVAEDGTLYLTHSAGVIVVRIPLDDEAFVALLVEAGDQEAALAALERVKDEQLRAAVRGVVPPVADQKAAASLAQARAAEQRERQAREAMRSVLAESPGPKTEAKVAALKSEIAAARSDFFSQLHQIEARHPQYASLVRFRALDLAGLQRHLPRGSALLEYFPAADTLYVFVVTPETFAVVKVGVTAAHLEAQVRALRGSMRPDLDRGEPDPKARPRPGHGALARLETVSAELYRHLVAPLQPHLAGRTTLLLVPSGPLNYLPFAALGRREGGTFRYLVEDHALAVLPALKQLDASPAGATTGAAFVGLGNPDDSLEEAAAEVKAIAALFPGAQVVIGAAASRAWLEQRMGSAPVVHLATHAYLNAKDPLTSYIVVGPPDSPDSRLRVRDIFGLQLQGAPLVTLSACNTAMAQENPGAELASLAQAFGIAGAPRILASLWAVPDQATQELMVAFYRDLRAGPAAALAAAQRRVLHTARTAHPFYWAAFTLYGRP